jgi:hypothetical protein
MFSKFLFGIFKKENKVEEEIKIVPHPHRNVDDFIASFNDIELDSLRSEMICCELAAVEDHIQEILLYLKEKCSEEDLKWYEEEIRKEYKK